MPSEHYFSKEPSSQSKLKQITINLAGIETNLTTDAGTFSSSRLDPGTRVLLDEIDLAPQSGNILDIGCGWGPISLALARLRPQAKIWAVDVNNRSLETLKINAANLSLGNIEIALPEEVPENLLFDGIWSNPPIRIGKQALHELLLHWLPRLSTGASAHLVVQKNLGADSLQKWLAETLGGQFEVSRLSTNKGYRILQAKRIN